MTIATPDEIVFIDRAASDLCSILAGLPSGMEVILLGFHEDELSQIARILDERPSVRTVHIVAQVGPDGVGFASGPLSLVTLSGHGGELARIGRGIGEGGVLALWGCAPSGDWQCDTAFILALERAAGARVAVAPFGPNFPSLESNDSGVTDGSPAVADIRFFTTL